MHLRTLILSVNVEALSSMEKEGIECSAHGDQRRLRQLSGEFTGDK